MGISFLAGLGFALLLIPVNRWLAEKIQKLSQEMMTQKDKRVKVSAKIHFVTEQVGQVTFKRLFALL